MGVKKMDFSDMIGNEMTIQYIKQLAIKKNILHAYLISGEKGLGKKLLANIFSKFLQCEQRGNICNQCKSCKQVDSKNHPDIIYVTHQKATIGVDDIRRQVNDTVFIKPYQGPNKIYMIDEAQLMTEQAQNALLKTIEEPPDYAVFFLLVENEMELLPTIRSRCFLLQMSFLGREQIERFLIEKKGVFENRARLSAAFSNGNLGKAIAYADPDNFSEIEQQLLFLLKRIDHLSIAEIKEKIKQLPKEPSKIQMIFDFIMMWYRDILLLKFEKKKEQLIYQDEYEFLMDQAEKKKDAKLEYILQNIIQARKKIETNVNFEISLEVMFLSMKEKINATSNWSEI